MTDDILIARQSFGNQYGSTDKWVSFERVNKMIFMFLTRDRREKVKVEVRRSKYTKEELASRLGVTLKELENFKKRYFYREMIGKINNPLINLYCSTKWAN